MKDLLKSKKAKLGIVVLALLLGASYFMSPDEAMNIKGVVVTKGTEVSLEELKRQDEEYRKMQMEGKIPEKYQKKEAANTNQQVKPTGDGLKTTDDKEALEAFKKQLAAGPKALPENEKENEAEATEQVAQNNLASENQKTLSETKEPNIKTVDDNSKIVQKTIEEPEPVNAPEANNFDYSYKYPEQTELSLLDNSNEQNLNQDRFHLVIRQTDFFNTKIKINNKYFTEINASASPRFYSYSIPESNLDSMLLEVCFEHRASKKRNPSASELVRVELLDMQKFEAEARYKETKRLHHDVLKSIISPLGNEFIPGETDCKTTEVLGLNTMQ